MEQAAGALTETVGKVLQRALAKNPNQRFSSCSDFIGALSISLGECPDWVPEGRSVETDASAFEETSAGARQISRERPLQEEAKGSGRAPVASVPPSPSAAVETVLARPVIVPPSAARSYESPTRPRFRRDDDDHEEAQTSSIGKKLGLILAMLFAIAAAIVFIVRWNSGPPIPSQTLDSNSGPATAPPGETSQPKRDQNPSSGNTAFHPSQQHAENRAKPSAPAGVNAPAGSADFEMLTDPSDATLVVDDRPDLTCHSPCTLTLPAGRHTLTAELTGYNVAHRIFTVPNDASLYIPLNKSMGTLVVTSSLSGSVVLVDGKQYGQAPLTLHLPAGVHTLVCANGSKQQEETVAIQADTIGSRSCQFR